MYRFCRRAAKLFGWLGFIVFGVCLLAGLAFLNSPDGGTAFIGCVILGINGSSGFIGIWLILRFIAWCAKPETVA